MSFYCCRVQSQKPLHLVAVLPLSLLAYDSQPFFVSWPWQFCEVPVRHFAEGPSIWVCLMFFSHDLDWGYCFLEMIPQRPYVLWKQKTDPVWWWNESVEKGRFNDFWVREYYCQFCAFDHKGETGFRTQREKPDLGKTRMIYS